jgi:hypothetical protein
VGRRGVSTLGERGIDGEERAERQYVLMVKWCRDCHDPSAASQKWRWLSGRDDSWASRSFCGGMGKA